MVSTVSSRVLESAGAAHKDRPRVTAALAVAETACNFVIFVVFLAMGSGWFMVFHFLRLIEAGVTPFGFM